MANKCWWKFAKLHFTLVIVQLMTVSPVRCIFALCKKHDLYLLTCTLSPPIICTAQKNNHKGCVQVGVQRLVTDSDFNPTFMMCMYCNWETSIMSNDKFDNSSFLIMGEVIKYIFYIARIICLHTATTH